MDSPIRTQSLRSSSTKSSFDKSCSLSRDQVQASPPLPGSQHIWNAEERPTYSEEVEANSERSKSHKIFERVWTSSTQDNNLALYGFRRFKTTHLLNLRLLEEEIDRIDHQIYQAGLKLGIDPAPNDRLGLKHCRRDEHALSPEEILGETLILKLRELLKQYDDGLASFNKLMTMETCSMIDDQRQASLRTDLSLEEIYETRLVRVDLGPRNAQDPFQRFLNKCLRWCRYRRLSVYYDNEKGIPRTHSDINRHKWSYQNTVALADIVWRILIALGTNFFILVPLAILSYESNKGVQLVIVTIWVAVFSFLTSIIFKASNQATVAVIAAYAAVLSVFISNGSSSYI